MELHADWGAEKAPELSGGPLRAPYTFWQMHFHWGTDNLRGSEHTINNVSFPMEVHAVHFKSEYGSARNALRYPDGLAVVSFLYQVCILFLRNRLFLLLQKKTCVALPLSPKLTLSHCLSMWLTIILSI